MTVLGLFFGGFEGSTDSLFGSSPWFFHPLCFSFFFLPLFALQYLYIPFRRLFSEFQIAALVVISNVLRQKSGSLHHPCWASNESE